MSYVANVQTKLEKILDEREQTKTTNNQPIVKPAKVISYASVVKKNLVLNNIRKNDEPALHSF